MALKYEFRERPIDSYSYEVDAKYDPERISITRIDVSRTIDEICDSLRYRNLRPYFTEVSFRNSKQLWICTIKTHTRAVMLGAWEDHRRSRLVDHRTTAPRRFRNRDAVIAMAQHEEQKQALVDAIEMLGESHGPNPR